MLGGGTYKDLACELIADFKGVTITSAEVRDKDGNRVTSCGQVSDSVTLNVLRGEDYTLILRQGNSYQETKLDCSNARFDAGKLACTLTVSFPGITITSGEVRDAEDRFITKCGSMTDSASFNVLRGEGYKIILRVGSKYYTYTGISCLGATAQVEKTRLTVSYPGVKDVNWVTVTKGGKGVASHSWTSDETSFELGAGTYDITVAKSGMSYEFKNVFLLGGEVTASVPILDLEVNYPGVKSVNWVTVYQNDKNIESHDWTSDSTSFKVFNNGTDYTVSLKKGGMSYTDTIQCSMPVLNVPILDLEVNYPGVKNVNWVTVYQNDTKIEAHDWTSDSTSFRVFNNGTDYAVSLKKGGMSYTGTVQCSMPVLNVPVVDLIVMYPGVKNVNWVTVYQNDTKIEAHDWTSDSTSFRVFNNGTDYTVSLKKGGMTYTGTAPCADPIILDVPITNLQIKYPGISSVNRVQVTANGTNVESREWTSNATDFYVFQSDDPYTIVITKGSETYRYNSVLCKAETVVVDKAGVLLNMPGIKADLVQFKQGSSVKYTFYGVASGQKLTVLNGIYDIVISKAAMKIQLSGVICLGDEMSKAVPAKKLTFNFTGIKADYAQLRQDGAAVQTIYGCEDFVTFDVFDNGKPYEALFVRGGMRHTATGNAADETVEVDVKSLTFRFDGIKADYVQLRQNGTAVQTIYSCDGEVTFNVFENGTPYEALIVRGGMRHTATGNAADGTVDVDVKTLTFRFDGIKADYVQLRQNGTAVQTIYSCDGEVSFNVFENGTPYEALIVRGGMRHTATGNAADGIVEVDVKSLTFRFDGIKADYVQLRQNGTAVQTIYSCDGEVSFNVFENGTPYEALFVRGGMRHTATGAADGTVDVDVKTLTFRFDGIKADYVQLRQNGTAVQTIYSCDGEVSFNVFENGTPYEALIVRGGMRHTAMGNAADGIVEVDVHTLTFSFTGLKADYVQLKKNGTVIQTIYGCDGEVTFNVFDSEESYEALIVKGSARYTATGRAGDNVKVSV